MGHEFLGVSLDVLLGRMKDLRADHWSRIGRFRRTKMNLGRPGTNLRLLYGRLVCDLASDGAKVRGPSSSFRSSATLVRLPREGLPEFRPWQPGRHAEHLISSAISLPRPLSHLSRSHTDKHVINRE